jgi:dolichol-phosphate mannosyltransferase
VKLSVVIAAYDERENIEPLVKRLLLVLPEMTADEWEILFVVEGTDGTREILEGFQRKTPQIRVLYGERPSGLGAAFRRGFTSLAPDRDIVATMDADLNHQPEEIPRLVETLRKEKADIVVGSRFVPGGRIEGTPFWKRVLSRTMNETMKGLFGLSVHDKTSGFRVYRGDALRVLSFRNDDFAFLPELLIAASRSGMKIVEEPIRFVYRTTGTSKMAIAKTIRSYLKLLFT